MLKPWEELPDFMRVPEVRPYYDILKGRKLSLLVKRVFDFVAAVILLLILAIPMAVIAVNSARWSAMPTVSAAP